MSNKENQEEPEINYPESIIKKVMEFIRDKKTEIINKKHKNDPIIRAILGYEPDFSLDKIDEIWYEDLLKLQKNNIVVESVKFIDTIEFINTPDGVRTLPTEDIYIDKIFPNLQKINNLNTCEFNKKNQKY